MGKGLQRGGAPKPIKLYRQGPRQPLLAPGGLSRLIMLVLICLAFRVSFQFTHSIVKRVIDPRPAMEIAPPYIQELTADCILNGRKDACAIAWAWRRH
jgi:hypothetical protein